MTVIFSNLSIFYACKQFSFLNTLFASLLKVDIFNFKIFSGDFFPGSFFPGFASSSSDDLALLTLTRKVAISYKTISVF